MVEVTGRYLGDLRCESTHGPSGVTVETDAPADHEGQGRRFSPTDLVGTALGSCILTLVGIVARRRELDVSGARFRVRKEMVSDPRRRIGKLETTIWLPDHLGEKDRRALEAAARACPVHRSIEAGIDAPMEFRYVPMNSK